jgi:hypothetical protein
MIKFSIIIILLLTVLSTSLYSQKQLVVLRKQKVLLRLYPGDEIVLKKKGSKRIIRSYVNNIFEDALVTHRDTIPFNKIDRIYFKTPSRLNVIGGLMLFGGAAFLVLDQVNNSLIQGNDQNFDQDFTRGTLTVMAIGLPLFLIKKKSQKIGYKNRVFMISKGSGFYRPDLRKQISPYSDN